MPDYWAKVVTKHFTAFSRQIREGVTISRMTETTDIIMNSKREITGNRVSRKTVKVNEEEIEILKGDISKLESNERKLLKELELGGEEYLDTELWERVIAGGKRKVEVPSNPIEEKPVEETTGEKSSKRQRLMTEYLVDLETPQPVDPQPQVIENNNLVLDELEELKSMMLEASMVRKGTKAMRRSSRKKEEAKELY